MNNNRSIIHPAEAAVLYIMAKNYYDAAKERLGHRAEMIMAEGEVETILSKLIWIADQDEDKTSINIMKSATK